MKYIETKHEFIYAGSDGELYTSYYPGYTLKKSKIRKGLKIITIRSNGNKKYISVAKEVGIAFVPNPEGLRYIKEKDGDPNWNCNLSENIFVGCGAWKVFFC